MTTLIFVRHGQSEGNLKKIFTGQPDLPLTELGRAYILKRFQNGFQPSIGHGGMILHPFIRMAASRQMNFLNGFFKRWIGSPRKTRGNALRSSPMPRRSV
ncbi:MAG: phosphoglycerate mutase family protein [Ruminococcaceae bacterium]|nr:phosphoglycerate mutase family protein [Oscillospiraceae bacterium]